jgi:hypothetical protein
MYLTTVTIAAPISRNAWRQVQAAAGQVLVATLVKAFVLTVSTDASGKEVGLTKPMTVKIVNGGMEGDKQ